MSPRSLGPDDPERMGPYALDSKLGEGGMGAVYLGRRDGGPHVAVKVVRAELAGDEAFLARFRDEVGHAERVASFCTAQVLDHGEAEGRAYMVTEYIDGPSLHRHVAENGALTPGMLHGVAVGVAAALAAIHSAGLVHRDLKPSNVLLSISGPRVIDFGIARALDVASAHTRTGQVVGSPGWIAPEQILNHPVTAAADVFAWGCLMAFAASGANPFGTGTFQMMAARVVHADPDVSALPTALADLVLRALDKDPGNRPTAQELLLTLVESNGSADTAVATKINDLWPGGAEALETPEVPETPETPDIDGDPEDAAGWVAPDATTTPVGPPPPERHRSWRVRTAAVVAAGVAVAAIGGAAYTLTSGDGEGGGSPKPAPPLGPMLVRVDTRPGWPAKCHAKIGKLTPRPDGLSAPAELIPGRGCDMLPQWSPDRRQVAFLRREGKGQTDLWVMGADGAGPRRLVSSVRADRMAWSADGREIAYTRAVGPGTEIFITDLTGKARRLTTDGALKADLTWAGGKLAFYRGRGADRQVHSLRPENPTGSWRQITTSRMAPDGVDDPRWSPDGTHLVFTIKNRTSTHDLGLVGEDGTGFRRLTSSSLNDHDPAWSPDGRWLAFSRGPYASARIWVMPVAAGERESRPISADQIGHAHW